MKDIGTTEYVNLTTNPLADPGKQNDTHSMHSFVHSLNQGGIESTGPINHTGTNGADRIIGSKHGDTFDLGGGDDRIRAGKGNDIITGGFGNDTYIYRRGDGKDTIHDYHESNFGLVGDAGTLDTLVLEDIKMNQVRTERCGNNLVLHFAYENGISSTDSVTIANYYAMTNGGTPVEKIKFKGTNALDINQWLIEGTQGDDSRIEGSGLSNLIYGYDGTDFIYGNGGADIIFGGDGGDYIHGGDYNDTIEGGRGNDTINSGKGMDVVVFNAGDGQDTLYDTGGRDTLILNGFNPEGVLVHLNGNGTLEVSSGADKVSITDCYGIEMKYGQMEYTLNPGYIENIMVVNNGEVTQLRYNPYTNKVTLVKITNPDVALQQVLTTLNTDYTQAQTIAAPRRDPLIWNIITPSDLDSAAKPQLCI